MQVLRRIPGLGLIMAIGGLAVISGCSSTSVNELANPAVRATGPVDPQRYSGRWFEIARIPNKFQEQCAGNVTATYAQDGRGGLSVANQCLTASGQISKAIGRARRVADDAGKLKVSFLPSLLSKLSWFPFGWSDYWILDLPPDYSHALIGTPDNEYLWILSRTDTMPEPTYFRLSQLAASMGYDTESLVLTPQRLSTNKAEN